MFNVLWNLFHLRSEADLKELTDYVKTSSQTIYIYESRMNLKQKKSFTYGSEIIGKSSVILARGRTENRETYAKEI